MFKALAVGLDVGLLHVAAAICARGTGERACRPAHACCHRLPEHGPGPGGDAAHHGASSARCQRRDWLPHLGFGELLGHPQRGQGRPAGSEQERRRVLHSRRYQSSRGALSHRPAAHLCHRPLERCALHSAPRIPTLGTRGCHSSGRRSEIPRPQLRSPSNPCPGLSRHGGPDQPFRWRRILVLGHLRSTRGQQLGQLQLVQRLLRGASRGDAGWSTPARMGDVRRRRRCPGV
mmetsp:Transcript_23983/g.70675  ORF Transcript_23983/g.70675 Transcript_23983/m.70675 type:complete len:233 (+) Transcript_23983:355-1053(+)